MCASGAYARRPKLPYTPGADAAGIVQAVGHGVVRFVPGQRVYIIGTVAGAYGACAELAVCDPAQVHPLPDSVSFEQGAAVGVPYGTAYRAIFQRAEARPGESVLVHGGSGGVGTAAIQLARAAGMVVLATAGTERGLAHLAAMGAAHAFNHSTQDYTDRIMEATEGLGVDVILEMLANVNLNRDLGLLARKGRVVVIGSRGTIEIDARQAMARDADIRGMILVQHLADGDGGDSRGARRRTRERHAAAGGGPGVRAGGCAPGARHRDVTRGAREDRAESVTAGSSGLSPGPSRPGRALSLEPYFRYRSRIVGIRYSENARSKSYVGA